MSNFIKESSAIGQALETAIVSLEKHIPNKLEKRLINADVWIDKLQNIAHDASAPGQYADYCMHLISEIEAELLAQKGEA